MGPGSKNVPAGPGPDPGPTRRSYGGRSLGQQPQPEAGYCWHRNGRNLIY